MPIDPRFLPIPCGHESGGVPKSREIPDHHPMTAGEIRDLFGACMEGIATGGVSSVEAAKMQMRLAQAVPGAVCPRSTDDENAIRSTLVNKLFVEAMKAAQNWHDCGDSFSPPSCYCDAIIGVIYPHDQDSEQIHMSESQNPAPTPAYEERRAAFLRDLTELTRKHRVSIWGCGCCGSPRLQDESDVSHEDMIASEYSQNGYSADVEFERPKRPK